MEALWNKVKVWKVEEVAGGRQFLFLWHSIQILELSCKMTLILMLDVCLAKFIQMKLASWQIRKTIRR